MSRISQYLKKKFNPFTGRLDYIGASKLSDLDNDSDYVTQTQLGQRIEPIRAEMSVNNAAFARTLASMQQAMGNMQVKLEASSAYYGFPILVGNTIRSLGVSDIQGLLRIVEFGASLQIQLSDQVATKDGVRNAISETSNSISSAMNAMANSMSNGISTAYNLANEAKQLAVANGNTTIQHWETYPVLASESGDEFSQLASGLQNNQGIIFWMSILSKIQFSECLIYAVSHPSDFDIQVGIYDNEDHLLYKTAKHTVTNIGTVRFAFVDNNGNPTTCTLSNDALYKIAIWSSANNFRILAGQDCSSAFESIRKLMSAKLVANANGITDTATIVQNSHINRFPYIKLVG